MTFKLIRYWLLCCLLALGGAVWAQEADENVPTIAPLAFNTPVVDTITPIAFYDWWEVDLVQGEMILITMEAFDGLVPLLGIVDETRELLLRSDSDGVAEPNATLEVRFTAPARGRYLVVASRDGNQFGTTSGTYRLTVDSIGRVDVRENTLQAVEFRCGERIITSALVLQLEENRAPRRDGFVDFYAVTVFGYDGFQPVIRAEAPELRAEPLDCTSDGRALPSSGVRLPDLPERTFGEEDEPNMARLIVQNTADDVRVGELTFTIGSLNRGRGRFVVVVQGLQIAPRDNVDTLTLRLAPLTRTRPLSVYALREANTRLDIALSAVLSDGTSLFCDDSGRGDDCADAPSLTQLRVWIADGGGQEVLGTRFDASLVLTPASTDPMLVRVASRGNETAGGYTLIFVGELP